MALTDGEGMNTTMLVSPSNGYPVYQNSGFGNGFGDNSWWIILLFILLLGGNWNNGNGNNGYFGAPYVIDSNGGSVQRGFDQASIMNGITDISSSICNGFSNVQQSLCNGFAGVNATVNTGFANAETANNARQMADMQQMFALQSQLAQCCCDNRLATANLQSVIQTENCADRQVVSDGIRDLLVANNANTQRILDTMCQDKIDAKNERIADLERQLTMANLSASQNLQTQQLLADNALQTNAIESYLAPVPRPAYIVQNPNCCTNTCGCSGNF